MLETASPYLWLKALHVVAAITFVGGMLSVAMLLPLLSASPSPSQEVRSLAVGLHRWQRLVTTPAMLVVWALGLTLALWGGWFGYGWLQAKLALVVALSALHGVQSGVLRRVAGGSAPRPRWPGGGVAVAIGLVTGVAVLVIAIR